MPHKLTQSKPERALLLADLLALGAAIAVAIGGDCGGLGGGLRGRQPRAKGRVVQLAVVRRRSMQHLAVPDHDLTHVHIPTGSIVGAMRVSY